MLRILEQRVMFPRAGQFSDAIREQLAGGYRVAARQQVMQAALEQVEMETEPRGADEVLTARLAVLDVDAARALQAVGERAAALLRGDAGDVKAVLHAVVLATQGGAALADLAPPPPPLPGAWQGGPDEERPVTVEGERLVLAVAEQEVQWGVQSSGVGGSSWSVAVRAALSDEHRRAGLELAFRLPSGEVLLPLSVTSRLSAPGLWRIRASGTRA